MLRRRIASLMLFAAAVLAGQLDVGSTSAREPFDWRIPDWLPPPAVPADNPMSDEKVALGRRLFYDKRLSRDGSMSCATCHEQKRGFTDGKRVGVAFDGTHGLRNPMGLANVGYLPVLTWANPNLRQLETQALIPLFGDNPVEMGMAGHEQLMFERLSADPIYPPLFAASFPEFEGSISLATVTRALAAFQRTLISVNAPYDRYKYGKQADAISKAAKRGDQLFFSHRLECYHCHGGFNFTDNVKHARTAFDEVAFHNNGFFSPGPSGAYPAGGDGLGEFSGRLQDKGRFRTPSLRNVTVTAPYMHDGSVTSLDDVLRSYSRGGRIVHAGPSKGDGARNPHKDPLIVWPRLSEREISDLKAFLASLTDQSFLTDPRHSNPWTSGANAAAMDRQQRHP